MPAAQPDRLEARLQRERQKYGGAHKTAEVPSSPQLEVDIHSAFDETAGIAQADRVADYVFENAFVPLHGMQRSAR